MANDSKDPNESAGERKLRQLQQSISYYESARKSAVHRLNLSRTNGNTFQDQLNDLVQITISGFDLIFRTVRYEIEAVQDGVRKMARKVDQLLVDMDSIDQATTQIGQELLQMSKDMNDGMTADEVAAFQTRLEAHGKQLTQIAADPNNPVPTPALPPPVTPPVTPPADTLPADGSAPPVDTTQPPVQTPPDGSAPPTDTTQPPADTLPPDGSTPPGT